MGPGLRRDDNGEFANFPPPCGFLRSPESEFRRQPTVNRGDVWEGELRPAVRSTVGLYSPRIDNRHTATVKIGDIAGDDARPVNLRNRRDH